MCPGAHSLGPPGGLCESRPYRNCPPIRNGISGGRWKSALHNMPCRIVSERHRQNRPYRAYQAFLVADRRSRQQLQLGNRHSRRQLSPLQSLRPPLGGAISNVKTYSEKAEASRDGRKLRRATQSSGECFPRPCSQASAFSSIHKPDIGTVSEQADKIKRWIERTNPRFDSAKSRFERTNPRFDSEVVKTESKIGPTDSYKKVMPNMLNIKARP